MTAAQIISEVRAIGGALAPSPNGGILYRLGDAAPRLLPAIRERKGDLLVLLRYPSTACPTCDGDRFRPDEVGVWRCEACQPENQADPFGVIPRGEADALAELELRSRLRQPEFARLILSRPVIVQPPVSASIRALHIAAASVVWATGGPESIARRHAAAWDGIPETLVAGRSISFVPAAGTPTPGEWARTPRGAAVEALGYDATSGEVVVRPLAAPPRWQWLPAAALISEIDWPLEAKR